MSKTRPLHELVAERVESAGVSRQELATKTGWSYLRVLRLLNGDTDLSAEDMLVLARVLGCQVADLYRGARAS